MDGQARPELPSPEGGMRLLAGPRILGTLGVLGLAALGLVWFLGTSGPVDPSATGPALGTLPISARESSLMERIEEQLFGVETVTELNLDAPTEQDRRFLLEILRTGTQAGRASALRALVLLQEPRAVGVLVRLPGTPADRESYCAGALEIVRHQVRELAAELLVEALAESPGRVDARCVAKLSVALELIGGKTPEVLEALLESASPRAQRFALQHWTGAASQALIERVMTLANASDPLTGRLADAWLKQQGYEPTAAEGAP